ncbi:MAG: cytidine deaminase [Lachnospiraceae bacterium]|nr:cytidine deaminase [Lachnospiraceae bacterium]
MKDQLLIEEALLAREQSYCPYSNFAVGAALLTGSGKIYHGCNIENASYSVANCAERTAIFKAVSEGEKEFIAIAVVGGQKDAPPVDYTYPCGVCRQVMSEFGNPEEFRILVAKSVSEYKTYVLKDLLPESFSLL